MVSPLMKRVTFLPDFSRIPDAIARDSGLLMLNYPHNPTGALATPELFRAALDFAREHHIPLVHDFAYAAIGSTPDETPLSLLAMPGGKEWGVETYTLSKTFSMAGWRFGFAVGNASIIRAFKSCIRTATAPFSAPYRMQRSPPLNCRHSVCSNGWLSITSAARGCWKHWRQCHGRYAPDRAHFSACRAARGHNATTFSALLLHKAHVLVAPGLVKAGENHIRISLTAGDDALKNALARIAALRLFSP